jgi:RNA polymerase sigma-70 factor (ECF subfamily)
MPTFDPSETELVGRVLAQQPGAWRAFEARYRRIIHRCILMTLSRHAAAPPGADVDEVYGELLLSLLDDDMRKLRLWDPARGASLGSWLGLLARNAAHDFVRGGHPTRAADAGELDRLTSPERSPLDAVLADERRALVSDTLGALRASDRRFLSLYFGERLTVEELAAKLCISVKTVYTRKHKLLTRLAAEMAAT